jgi:glyoxylase-like metal-dependent hydrolase (beta-lactamase superfamily II)
VAARFSLGNFELIAVSDGIYRLDGGGYFGVVPKVLWERKAKPDEKNRVPTGLNSVVVRTGEQTVLIETGIGNKLSEKMQEIYGQPAKLLENLSAAGIAPEEIDIVINSHLHFDHCGWNTVRKGEQTVATFPRAKYFAPLGEWEYSRHPSQRDGISFISANYDPLVESGQMTLLKGGEEIVPGISVRTFPGHTAHMQAIIVSSGGQTACYISDLIPSSAHMDLAWGMSFDLYPLDVIESKQRYYEESAREEWLTMFTHDPEIPWGYIERDEKGKMRLRPVTQ